MEKLEVIRNKIEEIKKDIQKKLDFHNEILNSLTKLNNERDIVRNDINTLNGALSAYQETVNFLSEGQQSIEDVVIEAEVV
jgi:uncharacterized phage infection (PIP) family protein YhgE